MMVTCIRSQPPTSVTPSLWRPVSMAVGRASHYTGGQRRPSGEGVDMEYRRLGNTGLQLSGWARGSWVTCGDQLDVGLAADCMAAARQAGANYFDNAESYAGGDSERIMGEAIARLGWPRHSYVVSTKLFWGI